MTLGNRQMLFIIVDVLAVTALICTIILFVRDIRNDCLESQNSKMVSMPLLALLICVCNIGIQASGSQIENTKTRTEAEILCEDAGFTLYLDGEEVDAEKIDFNQYSTPSIDLEKKEIYLSR